MASPAYSAKGAVTDVNNTTSVPRPTVAAGDFMLLVVAIGFSDASVTATGWTSIESIDPNSQFQTGLEAFYKIAGGSEPATYSITISGQGGSNNFGTAQILSWTGADGTTPVNVSANQTNASSTSVAIPSVTATVADTTLVAAYGIGSAGSPTFTPDASMTERADDGGTYNFSVADEAVAASGATGTRTATASSAIASRVIVFAIAPPAGGTSATTYTLEGPSTGTVGVASSDFTVTPDAAVSADVVVTPSDGGDGGTFSPTSVTFASGTSTPQTFTYTPASAGVKTISTTNDGSLTDPASVSFTASAASSSPTLVQLERGIRGLNRGLA